MKRPPTNLIEYFDRVQVINLEQRKDRRIETCNEFKRYNFPINTDKVTFFKAISPNTAGGFDSIGARGCFLSHLNILENAKNNKYKNILILEDDIAFSKNIKKHENKAIQLLEKKDWDIAYFGHALGNTSDEISWIKMDQPIRTTHCYAVNGKILDRFTEFLQNLLKRKPGDPLGGPMHYDGAINTFVRQNSDVNVYYISNNLGYQRSSATNIHDLSIYDTNVLLKIFVNLYRKLKRIFHKLTR